MQRGEQVYEATEIQKYSHDLVARVTEVDNAFNKLYIALENLRQHEFPNSEFDFSSNHSYHVENFLLRVTTIVDRCHLFAGTALLMSNKVIERMNGNSQVKKELSKYSENSLRLLRKMDAVIGQLKRRRNEIAHQEGYSSKNLIALQVYEAADGDSFRELDSVMSICQLKSLIVQETMGELEPMVSKLELLVNDFIDSLAFLYLDLVQSST